MIHFDGVSKVYTSGAPAVYDITLSIEPREFVSIIGKSGAGKSTLLKLLLAEECPTTGTVFFDAINVHDVPRRQLSSIRQRMGAVFQDVKLISDRTAFENVAFVLEAAGAPDADIGENVMHALEIVGLPHKADAFPAQLSGGERQRVAIARAIINSPDVVLADEPTGNLDPINTAEIVHLMQKINELGITVLMTTHSEGIVNHLGRRVIVMDNGTIVSDEKEGRYRMADEN
ncbi:MAG: ATP-binding cassette domain-containing protein [bacterium]|nr:ATP-binding cassette domain-containing protein [bacterium]